MDKRKKRNKLLIMSFTFITLTACALFPFSAKGELSCDEVLSLTIPDTTIMSAEVVPSDGVPAYCKVEGYVETPGLKGEPDNKVNFRVGLPISTWNGKFYFQGIGGLAGSIPSIDFGLVRGYASAATDTGHQAGIFDADWAYCERRRENVIKPLL